MSDAIELSRPPSAFSLSSDYFHCDASKLGRSEISRKRSFTADDANKYMKRHRDRKDEPVKIELFAELMRITKRSSISKENAKMEYIMYRDIKHVYIFSPEPKSFMVCFESQNRRKKYYQSFNCETSGDAQSIFQLISKAQMNSDFTLNNSRYTYASPIPEKTSAINSVNAVRNNQYSNVYSSYRGATPDYYNERSNTANTSNSFQLPSSSLTPVSVMLSPIDSHRDSIYANENNIYGSSEYQKPLQAELTYTKQPNSSSRLAKMNTKKPQSRSKSASSPYSDSTIGASKGSSTLSPFKGEYSSANGTRWSNTRISKNYPMSGSLDNAILNARNRKPAVYESYYTKKYKSETNVDQFWHDEKHEYGLSLEALNNLLGGRVTYLSQTPKTGLRVSEHGPIYMFFERHPVSVRPYVSMDLISETNTPSLHNKRL